VKLERRVGRFLFGEVLQTIGHGQRQFPHHSLEPHAADEHSDQPDSKVSAGTLRRILPPILDGHCNAGEQQHPEQREDQKAPASQTQIIIRRRGQEMPDVGEGICGHRRVLQESNRYQSNRYQSNSYSTYRLIESLLCVSVD
jgi:hypothetical protein